MMERGLAPWFDGSCRRYWGIFAYIGNVDHPPVVRQRVTLLHIYQALGVPLDNWVHWCEFVRTVPVEVLRFGSVSRKELREDPGRIVELRSRAPESKVGPTAHRVDASRAAPQLSGDSPW